MDEEARRGFGMAPGAAAAGSEPRPFWANPMLWALCGALAGAGLFVWSQKGTLTRAARRRLPAAQVAARSLAAKAVTTARTAAREAAAAADDLKKDVAAPPAEEYPQGVRADELDAPVDPAKPRAKGARRARRRDVVVGDYRPAGEVQDVRARWDAPDVSYEAPVPWTETDMAKGVFMTGGLAVFFWLFGWALFRFTSKRAKTF